MIIGCKCQSVVAKVEWGIPVVVMLPSDEDPEPWCVEVNDILKACWDEVNDKLRGNEGMMR